MRIERLVGPIFPAIPGTESRTEAWNRCRIVGSEAF